MIKLFQKSKDVMTMMRKVKMKLFIAFITCSLVTLLLSSCVSKNEISSNLDYVDPHIGGVGFLLHPTRPNIQLPNQMIRMHPMRADYLDDQISFFPLTMRSHRDGEAHSAKYGSECVFRCCYP